MRTATPSRPAAAPAGRADRLFGRPAVALVVIAAALLALGWQFLIDSSRAVPAFDTAYYQWRVEYLLTQDPGSLIELRGATGALAGGYRVAEPVLGALMRTVGGLAAVTPTVLLSVLFRVLAAVGMASFAWRHRRSWSLFYLTLAAIPALFLLQRFFGYLDNFFTLSLLAGVLLLLEPVRTSWLTRGAVTMLLFLAGLSHPTTLAIFLLSIGALATYRLIRERSIAAAWRSEGWVLVCGAAAVVLTAAFWLGGLWGPTSSFSDAAVPPPETVEFFVNRSLGVLGDMTPYLLIPLVALGLGHLLVTLWRDREPFAEVTLAWTLPLGGMFGFLLGAAYPYFRFFNATLAPLLLAALGLWLLVWLAARVRRRPLASVLPAVAVAAVVAILGLWWGSGLSAWNSTATWLTPDIRSTTAAMSAYLRAAPASTNAVVLTDAQPGVIVPYGKYKEFANATYAGVDGDQIDDVTVFFGRVEDFEAGRASTSSDDPYNDISAETARDAELTLEAVVFVPAVFNDYSTNAAFVEACAEPQCVEVSDGLVILPEPSSVPVDDAAVAAARAAAGEAAAFAADPPGPFSGWGGTLLDGLRLVLLFGVPGLLLFLGLPERRWVEGLTLVPVLGIAATTTAGVLVVAVLRGPFTAGVGWLSWALAAIGAVALALVRRRRPARSSLGQ